MRELIGQGESTKQLMRELIDQGERNRVAYQDQLQITREVIRRNELAFRGTMAELRDLREESRAQRGALLTLIDEISGSRPPQTG